MLRKLGLATALLTVVALALASTASAGDGKPIDPPDEGKPIVGQERYMQGLAARALLHLASGQAHRLCTPGRRSPGGLEPGLCRGGQQLHVAPSLVREL